MRSYTRRQTLIVAGSGAAMFWPAPGRARDAEHFAAEAARMRRQAIAAGDQPYGAVLVLNGDIVGFGPSRVVTDRDVNAHAERVALWHAQKTLGQQKIDGAMIYATSQPCSICQKALVQAGIVRMYVGPAATDAGKPEP